MLFYNKQNNAAKTTAIPNWTAAAKTCEPSFNDGGSSDTARIKKRRLPTNALCLAMFKLRKLEICNSGSLEARERTTSNSAIAFCTWVASFFMLAIRDVTDSSASLSRSCSSFTFACLFLSFCFVTAACSCRIVSAEAINSLDARSNKASICSINSLSSRILELLISAEMVLEESSSPSATSAISRASLNASAIARSTNSSLRSEVLIAPMPSASSKILLLPSLSTFLMGPAKKISLSPPSLLLKSSNRLP
mmetsp:Transcript_13983/g.20016  ORF Transcript_13983/g.20016 Transcript_13983/m.20016 type:complete len:251 (+) Transcript_13983:336-1088(+)